MRTYCLAVTLCAAIAVPGVATAADYYLSAVGHDGNAGTSPAAPWRTLSRVNDVVLQPGDRVLLRGGDVFDGQLFFDQADAGTEAAPITVTSYGTGRATIRAAAVEGDSGSGIFAYNTAGYRISNLNVAGAGTWASGILFFTDLPGNVKLSWIRMEALDVAGFGRDGIEIGSFNGATGYRDVRLTAVTAHENGRTGILTYAQQPNVHESVYVGYSRAYNNPGIPTLPTNSGSGIVLGGVNGGMIERSVAYGNGWLCVAPEGPVGIWTYDSTRVVIQHNESYENRTGGVGDGGGFDLDQNVSESIIQYNYSHGNDGAGYLIAHKFQTDAHHSNIIRYNISENDGRRNSFGAIEVWGRTVGTQIHNNTVFLSPGVAGTPSAIRVWNEGVGTVQSAGLGFRNNILQTTGGIPLLIVSDSQIEGAGVRFEGNLYYSSVAAFTIQWGATSYVSLEAFRATTQETLSGAAVGVSADPMLTAAGSGGIVGSAEQLEELQSYRLPPGSPAVDTGLNLFAHFGFFPGARDFFGVQLPQGAGFDIGAGERATGPTMLLDKTWLRFAAVTNGGAFLAQTSVQTVRLTQTGPGLVTWTATTSVPWLTVSPPSGSGSAEISVGVIAAGAIPIGGSVTGSVALSFTGASNTPGPIVVDLTTYLAGTTGAPFGTVDTPLDHSTGVSGAVPFTGWSLDDVEVEGVAVCRDVVPGEGAPADPRCGGAAQVFIGEAVFIDGARPDVQLAFPTYPRSSRAGWGLMVLTNMLPDIARGLPTGGNGTYTFSVYARDREGHVALLGTRTMTCDNENATLPFGTIDTPGQGEVVSGSSYVNFGWVLTPQPKFIPFDGSTITVFIDGAPVGNPSYNHFRADIAGFFPGLANSNGAIGFLIIDTTQLGNGLHTIAWGVTDSNGATQGIGSRFFAVSNGAGAATTAAETGAWIAGPPVVPAPEATAATIGAPSADHPEIPLDRRPIAGRRGWDLGAPLRSYATGSTGRTIVRGEELDRFELHLGDGDGRRHTGYLRVGQELAPLPIGSTLDPATGVFTWHPGVGFVGTYDLVFLASRDGRPEARREVRIVLHPKGSGHGGPQVIIDAPAEQQEVGSSMLVGGWAADLDARTGTGVDAVHVWAYPLAGGVPVFLGAAAYGGARPDVAAVHGDRFRESGYTLIARGLNAGAYHLAVFARSTESGDFLPARVVSVTVR